MLAALALPLVVTVAIFLGAGWSFTHLAALSTSQSHGGGLGMNLASPLSLGAVVNVLSRVPDLYELLAYAWVPGVILASWPAAKWVRSNEPSAELRALLLLVTVFLLLRWGLYEQYMLYLFSLAALDVAVFHPGRRRLLLLTVGLASTFLLVNNELGLRFLAPADPGILSFTNAIDASSTWGVARIIALPALAILVTVTLIQWIRTFLRDDAQPEPWLLAWRSGFLNASRAGPPP